MRLLNVHIVLICYAFNQILYLYSYKLTTNPALVAMGKSKRM